MQEAEATEAIRIMTTHQAKGLGFDMVIVSGLDKTSPSRIRGRTRIGTLTKKNHNGACYFQEKDIAEADPVLSQQIRASQGRI